MEDGINGDGRLAFILTRENEGFFKCGERTAMGNTIMSTDDTAVKLIRKSCTHLCRVTFGSVLSML